MQTFMTDFLERRDPLSLLWIGKVEDNNDPKQLGRIKVRIPLYADIPKESLPWAVRFGSFGTGATDSAFTFSVPDVGSVVVVGFLNGDIHFPFYLCSPTNDLTNVSEWLSGYPDSYGYKDKKGNKIVVNEQEGTILVHHFSGTQIQIDNDGTVNITEVKDVNKNISNKVNISIGDKFIITVANPSDITCPTINVSGNIEVSGYVRASGGIVAGSGSPESGHVKDMNGTMQEMRDIYNSHTHTGDDGGTTSPPHQPME